MRAIAPRWRSLTAPLLAKRATVSWQASRLYSSSASQGPDPSKLVVEKTDKPAALQKPEDLVFGKTFTGMASSPFPHMRPMFHPATKVLNPTRPHAHH